MSEERIAKFLARAGICSRREAEKLIEAGKVTVNGTKLDTPAFKVSEADKVTVDGTLVKAAQPTKLWLYHKPTGLVTSHKDEQGRATVFDSLPKDLPRVVSVGRLDLNSEGLLLLTNDGGLAGKLGHPSLGWRRHYRVRVFGIPTEKQLDVLRRGATVEGVRYEKCDIELERAGRNSWLSVTLTEGKNREIRRLFEHIGFRVSRLMRLSFGPFQLGKLNRGAVREVDDKTLTSILGKLKG